MTTGELIKALRVYAECDKHDDCSGCQMPNKENPSYEKMCVGFAEEVLPQAADELTRLAKENAELREAQSWIPVEAKLPDKVCDDSSADLLIAIRYKYDLQNEEPSICTGYLLEEEWWAYMDHDCHEISYGDIVTHWMRLPKPPKKG